MEKNQVSQEGKVFSDGSTASYYELPEGCKELQDLISARNMNAQIGEIFRACYRYGIAGHSSQLRDAKKMLFYAKAEVERLEKLEKQHEEENEADSCHLTPELSGVLGRRLG